MWKYVVYTYVRVHAVTKQVNSNELLSCNDQLSMYTLTLYVVCLYLNQVLVYTLVTLYTYNV